MRLLPLVVFIAASDVSLASATQPDAPVAAGRALYKSVGCWECHGHGGQGGIATAPRLSRDMSCDAITAQLRHPADAMPPYSSAVLPEQKLPDLCTFLQSLPDPRHASDIPLLRAP